MDEPKKRKSRKNPEQPKKRGRPKGSKNKRTLAEEKMLANWTRLPDAPMLREDKAELNKAAGSLKRREAMKNHKRRKDRGRKRATP